MQASSHLELAHRLLQYFPSASPIEQAAFLFGSVEPDMNFLTYCRGLLHGAGLHGHNYAQVLPRIARLSRLLNGQESRGVQAYYRLGKLTHYIADAFTFPHNTGFCGSLRSHIRYEARLADCLHQPLTRMNFNPCASVRHVDFPGLVRWRHHLYVSAAPGPENDIFFIIETAQAAVLAFAPCPATYALPAATQRLGGALR